MGPILMKHRGYNILPQREGYFMFAFHSPVHVALFHRDFQAALLKVVWPARYKELIHTRPVYSDPTHLTPENLIYRLLAERAQQEPSAS